MVTDEAVSRAAADNAVSTLGALIEGLEEVRAGIAFGESPTRVKALSNELGALHEQAMQALSEWSFYADGGR